MNPKVLSIYQNAKMFLSDEELSELRAAIDKDLGKPVATKKRKKENPVDSWLDSIDATLLTTLYNHSSR
ncbi:MULTISPECIES: hypothetical protein [unclassified Flavobacterium]|uniref:hypothetical protein n=1 Tax=unclassified Flavobacterium TaxID=196869 RepID=UPI003606C812